MKKLILLVGLLTLVAFVSGAIAAAPPKAATTPATVAPAVTKTAPPAKLEKFGGKIKGVDAMAKTIVVVKGKEQKTFVLDDKTKITKGKDTLSFADTKAGMNVAIEYKKDGDKNVAVAIKVAEPKKK
jgi:Cu/Ag efflux protein CusF